ncbi:hypothetical protein MATL_G00025860 [Megalops atlanticus]|uniref:polynucleotide adenylyltransferase n=1 Tax=Megalops atlanticus TaxID=7932 RepID=A0A9D3QBW0_MEGAT|nr:hypothetical protein MATL_G00025860 [Megalops atlanticus]
MGKQSSLTANGVAVSNMQDQGKGKPHRPTGRISSGKRGKGKEKQEENKLRALPAPSPAQLKAVDAAVMEAARQQGISEEDFLVRQDIVSWMEEIIQQHLSVCSLRLYGCCLTRFAFKTSDVNIDVTFPSAMTQPDVLIQVHKILKNSYEYTDVESDFHAKVPVVFC